MSDTLVIDTLDTASVFALKSALLALYRLMVAAGVFSFGAFLGQAGTIQCFFSHQFLIIIKSSFIEFARDERCLNSAARFSAVLAVAEAALIGQLVDADKGVGKACFTVEQFQLAHTGCIEYQRARGRGVQ